MQLPRLCLVAVATIALTSPAWAADNDTLTVGFTVSQTGKLNTDSIAQMRGFELWRDQVNAKGGIKVGDKAYNIKFVSYDDESQNGRVQQLYTRLISQDNAQFLFSPYSSGLTATAAIISEQYGKIMLTTGAAEGKTYELGNKNLFQIYSPASRVSRRSAAGAQAERSECQDRLCLPGRSLLQGRAPCHPRARREGTHDDRAGRGL